MTDSASNPVEVRKAELRASLRAARFAMEPANRTSQAAGVSDVVLRHLGVPVMHPLHLFHPHGPNGRPRAAGRPIVAAYLGTGTEPDTAPLLHALDGGGYDVVLPVCEPHRALSWAFWRPGAPLERSRVAPVDEPAGPRRAFEELHDVRLVVVPALGVDMHGSRLGQGGGYYDRFLASHRPAARAAVPVLAVVYRSELLRQGTVPAGRFDEPVDGAITADRVHTFERRGPAV